MAYSTAAKNAMLDHLRTLVTHVSAHSAFPATAGNEISLARKPIAFNAASGGAIDDSTNGIALDIPAGATVAAIGFWGASTAGTLYADADVADEVYNQAGVYNVTDADLDLNA